MTEALRVVDDLTDDYTLEDSHWHVASTGARPLVRVTALIGSTTVRIIDAADNTSDFDNDGLPDRWEIQNNFDPNDATASNGATADTDRDGINTFGEYAFVLDPNASDASSATSIGSAVNPGDGKRYLTFSFRRRAGVTGITYQVQTSPDLVAWTTDGADVEIISTTPAGDGVTELVTVRISPPLDETNLRKFVRVRATSS